MTQTVFPVVYRDGANYKTYGTLVAEGAMTDAEHDLLKKSLDAGEMYLPLQLGLEYYGTDWSGYNPDDYDHPWHEMLVDEITIEDPERDFNWFNTPHVEYLGPVSEFVRAVAAAAAAGWDESRYAPDAS